MAKLTRDAVLKLAQLSRLKLTDDEIERLRQELSSVLDYVEMLDKVDVGDLEPTYQVTGLKNVMREDEPKNYQAKPEDLLKIANAVEKNQYKVKRVL